MTPEKRRELLEILRHHGHAIEQLVDHPAADPVTLAKACQQIGTLVLDECKEKPAELRQAVA